MLETVLVFGLLISFFEFVVICMIPVRARLRLLGSQGGRVSFHLCMFCINMLVHWGTIVGTMSATLAFICSLGVIGGAAKLFGFITEGRYYTLGFIRYNVEELK